MVNPHNRVISKSDPVPVPPLDLIKIVGSTSARNYLAIGRSTFRALRQHGGIKPSDRVLDVGCGCGRLALQLTDYLTTGSYDGFDVVPELVTWCRKNITPRYANFRFEHVDIANSFYHGRGSGRAAHYRFPHEDDVFDFTILTSVFTHMLRNDFLNYMEETARTLKPGGTVLMTFFLLNDESRQMKHKTMKQFKVWRRHQRGGVRVRDPERPEECVAYPEKMVRSVLRANGLEVQEILFGSWCGRVRTVAGQDIVIARKPRREEVADAPAQGNIALRLKRWFSRA